VVKLASTLNAGIQGMWQANGVAQSGIDVINNFNQGQENLTNSISELNDTVSVYGWCPLKRDDILELCNASGSANVSIANLSLECNVTDIPFEQEMTSLFERLCQHFGQPPSGDKCYYGGSARISRCY
jgi:hypothetical protein